MRSSLHSMALAFAILAIAQPDDVTGLTYIGLMVLALYALDTNRGRDK